MSKTKKIILFYIAVVVVIISLLFIFLPNEEACLKSWNEDGIAVNVIKEYVDDVCNKKSDNYIPSEDRVAVWDVDGTLEVECNEYGVSHMAILELSKAMIDSENIEGKRLLEEYAGIEEKLKEDYAGNIGAFYKLYDEMIAYSVKDKTPEELIDGYYSGINTEFFSGYTIAEAYYEPMKELYFYLIDNDFDVYFVSGSTSYSVYVIVNAVLGNEDYSIPFNHCIGTDLKCECTDVDGLYKVVFTGESDVVNTDFQKVNEIISHIGKTPVLAFGNSSADADMLNFVNSNVDYNSLSAIIIHDDERESIYSVDKMQEMAETYNWLSVSMKNDFDIIFAD